MVSLFAVVLISLMFVWFTVGLVVGEWHDDMQARRKRAAQIENQRAADDAFWTNERETIARRFNATRLF